MKAIIVIQSKFTNFDFKIKSAFSILAVRRVSEPGVVDPDPALEEKTGSDRHGKPDLTLQDSLLSFLYYNFGQ